MIIHITTLHITTLHITTLHLTLNTLHIKHYTSQHYTSQYYTTQHYTLQHYTLQHYTILHITTLHITHHNITEVLYFWHTWRVCAAWQRGMWPNPQHKQTDAATSCKSSQKTDEHIGYKMIVRVTPQLFWILIMLTGDWWHQSHPNCYKYTICFLSISQNKCYA